MTIENREFLSHLYPLRNSSRRRGSRFSRLGFCGGWALGLGLAALFATHNGHAKSPTAPLTFKERTQLENSGEVARRMELRQNGSRYIAAISYGVVPRSCDRVFALLSQPGKHYTRALPATAEVRFDDHGGESRLWMKHGNAFINGSYTTHFKVSEPDQTVRFWLDQKKPTDVKDLFGYFRVSHWGKQRCLVTAAVAVDPGKGMVASMFRGMISEYLSKSAGRIQRYARRTIEAGSTIDTGLVTAAKTP